MGLCVERSAGDWWSALLGVLKAGGAYVPLDPAYPAERLALHARRTAAAAGAGDASAGLAELLPADGVSGCAWTSRVAIAQHGEKPLAPAARPERPGLRHLHLGLDGPAEGRRACRTAAVVNCLLCMQERDCLDCLVTGASACS